MTTTTAHPVSIWDACNDPNPCAHCKAGRPAAPEDAGQPTEETPGIEMEDEHRAALPPTFHRPHFESTGKPSMWLCGVCWTGNGLVTLWPCPVAARHGNYLAQAWRDEAAIAAEAAQIAERIAQAIESQDPIDAALAGQDAWSIAATVARTHAKAATR